MKMMKNFRSRGQRASKTLRDVSPHSLGTLLQVHCNAAKACWPILIVDTLQQGVHQAAFHNEIENQG